MKANGEDRRALALFASGKGRPSVTHGRETTEASLSLSLSSLRVDHSGANSRSILCEQPDRTVI